MSNDRTAWLLGKVLAVVLRTIRALLRVRYTRPDVLGNLDRDGKPYIIAFWHGQLLLMTYARFSLPLTAMISQSRDGIIGTSVMNSFGVNVVQGSSSKGGSSALREMMKLVEAGHRLGITPDGPRGPRRIAQGGVVSAAQLSGALVVPITVTAKKKSF
ncbi:MAG TPA: DUF374 domain-containing protein [Thermoanaerobaculia bacterium]|nr:DUF374 domain-containing protein [Thermoanaerobaculia bacterium]